MPGSKEAEETGSRSRILVLWLPVLSMVAAVSWPDFQVRETRNSPRVLRPVTELSGQSLGRAGDWTRISAIPALPPLGVDLEVWPEAEKGWEESRCHCRRGQSSCASGCPAGNVIAVGVERLAECLGEFWGATAGDFAVKVEGLEVWTIPVETITGLDATSIQSNLPAPPPGYNYHNFRLDLPPGSAFAFARITGGGE